MELSAIDYIADKGGFDIFYEMLSLTKRKRVRVKTFIKEKESIESVYSLFKMANWQKERCMICTGLKLQITLI